MSETPARVRVLFCCTGVEIFNRGIESFFREAFDGLKTVPDLDAWLIKGAGAQTGREIPVWCLPRTGRFARWLGQLFHRNSYVVEQWSSFFPVVRHIRRLRPNIVFYSDANLGFQLFLRRNRIGVPYQLLFSNGGPVNPPFDRTDFVHQVAPLYYSKALASGEPAHKHFPVPYGIEVPASPACDAPARHVVRARLGLPLKPVILSVGAVNRSHKRMDYLIQEVARLQEPRPFLQIVGAMDEESPGIKALAVRLLGSQGCSIRSVPYADMANFYQAADVFALASLQEGFGRAYIEALMHGLPVIAHNHPVMEYVLGDQGVLGQLNQPGELARLLSQELPKASNPAARQSRWAHVRRRFSWPVLAPQYSDMFHQVFVRGQGGTPGARGIHAASMCELPCN
jgi:glycosyltransferase involved in cell wall biosynthesis